MKKHTSKSASETPTTSSRSGTSAKTAVTGKKPTSASAQSRFGYILAKAKKRTPEQARLAMIRAGIVTESGELTEHYRVKPKPDRKGRSKP